MTNTVAHTPLKRGTSARLGLRLPKPRARVDRLILAPADVWIRIDDAVRRDLAHRTGLLFDATFPPNPIPVTNVTASRNGEPVHVSEVIASLTGDTCTPYVPGEGLEVFKARFRAWQERTAHPKAWPGEFLMHDMVDCCDVVHTWSAGASSWLPGCAHYGAV